MSAKSLFQSRGAPRRAWQTAQVAMVLMLVLGAAFVPTRTARALSFTVNTTADTIDASLNGICADASGRCSLRAAVMEANANPGSTITFAASLNGTPIILTRSGNDATASAGDLDINANTTIIGNGAANTIIQGAADASYTGSIGDKIFGVNQDGIYPSLTVSFSGMTIRYGDNAIPYNDPTFAFTGGGVDIWQTGTGNSATFTDCVISYNRNRYGWGGGFNFDQDLFASGSLTLTNVTFDHNQTTNTADATQNREGGGLAIHGYQPNVTITNSTFTYNQTTDPDSAGGGIYIGPSYMGTIAIHGTTFDHNTATTGSGGGIAIYYWSSSDYYPVNITIDQNTIVTNNTAGNTGGGIFIQGSYLNNAAQLTNLLVSGNSAAEGGGIYVGLANATMQYSRIVNNTVTAGTGTGLYKNNSATTVTATRNWWGCSTGPGAAPCNRAVSAGGTLNTTPWLQGRLTASPTTLATDQTSTLTASFLLASDGSAISPANLDQIIGQPIIWNATGGSISGAQTTIQSDGRATATFTATSAGTAVAAAVVDHDGTSTGSNTQSITVNKANTTTAITSDLPDPSTPEQAVPVTFTVTGQYGNTPTAPAGNVTVSDGVNSCTGTVAAGSCDLTLTTLGARTLTATYAENANFNGSTSAGVSHTVNQAPAITSANSTIFKVGTAGSFTVTTTGSPIPAITETGALPNGVSFVDNGNGTATLSGTPAAGTTGTYNLTFTASNSILPNATQSFTLIVGQSPAITSANNVTFTAGTAGSFTIMTTGHPIPALSRTGALPGGVAFIDNGDGTATLSGTPAAGSGGTYDLTFTANNGVSPNATQDFTLTVNANAAPAITSANNATFTLGAAGSFTVTATGFPIPSIAFTGGGLPGGMTLVDNGDGTATLSGTPAAGTSGTFYPIFTASNGIAPDAVQNFTLIVGQAPAITSANNFTLTVGKTGSFIVRTTGYPAPALSRTGTLPGGVTFFDNGNGTATLVGTPAAGTTGTYPLTFTAGNGISPNATQGFTLTVGQAPAITSANHTTFIAGAAGSFTITTTGYPIPAIAWTGGGLPGGVTFVDNGNGTATLSGTVGMVGTFYLSFTASNGVSPEATQNFTLTIGKAPTIASANHITLIAEAAGSFTITTTGYPIPAIAQAGALPSGVSFTDNGDGTATLTGTPAAGSDGTYPLTFTAGNGVLPNATQNFTLTVGQVPNITSADSTGFTVGTAGSFTVTTTGYPIPAITLSGAALPSGVTFVDNGDGTAALSGTPAAGSGGTYALTFLASNGAMQNTLQEFTLTVGEAPTITSVNNVTFTAGTAGSFTITTTGYPVPAIARSGAALPGGVSFTDNGDGTATLAGTAALNSVGTYNLIFTAQNGIVPNASQNFTLTIDGPPGVSLINSVADTGDGQLLENERTTAAITQLIVVFNKAMNPLDAASLGNYQLVRDGSTPVAIDTSIYTLGTHTTAVLVNGGAALPDGRYTFTVKGNIRDTLGTPIGMDFVRNFYVGAGFGAGIYDDADAAWTWSGSWTPVSGVTGPYADTHSYAGTVGDYAELEFTGVKFKFTYLKASNRGLIDVYVDGTKITQLNAYSSTLSWQKTWISPDLANGFHTVRFVHAGGHRYIDIDALEIMAAAPTVGPGIYDDTEPAWAFSGAWTAYTGTGPYSDTSHYASTSGSEAQLTFTGSQFVFTYVKAANRGAIDVYVDGTKIGTINARSTTTAWQQTWTSPTFASGTHTVRFVHAGGGTYIDVDAIQILVPTDTTPPAAISDLSGAAGAAAGSVDLTWTAPGDDGTTGTAASYLVRYSTAAITNETTWGAATPVTTGVPTPAAAGATETMTVSGLTPGAAYFFAVRAQDEEWNLGGVSTPALPMTAQTYTPVPAGIYDDTGVNWIYTGTWTTYTGAGPYNGTSHYASTSGSEAQLTFTGTGFTFTYVKAANRGSIDVYVDGVKVATINAKSSATLWQRVWTSPTLTSGTHTVRFVHAGGGTYIDVDAITILP